MPREELGTLMEILFAEASALAEANLLHVPGHLGPGGLHQVQQWELANIIVSVVTKTLKTRLKNLFISVET